MAEAYPIQPGFLGGVLSPRYWGRTSEQRYQLGLEKCENWTITPQGGVRKRAGTEFLFEAGCERPVLVPFLRTGSDDVIVELCNENLRVLNSDGVLQQDVAQLLNNRFFNDGTIGWSGQRRFRSWDYSMQTLIDDDIDPIAVTPANGFTVNPGSGMTLRYTSNTFKPVPQVAAWTWLQRAPRLRQNVTTGNALATHTLSLALARNNISLDATDAVSGAFYTATAYVRVETSGGALIFEKWFDDDEYGLFEQTFVPNTTDFRVIFSMDVPPGDQNIGVEEVRDLILSNISVTVGTSSGDVEFPTPYQGDELPDIIYCQDAGAGVMFFTHPNHPIQQLSYDSASDSWSFAEVIPPGGKSNPADWTVGNYPSVCEIHQQRLYVAATPQQPNQLWASRVFVYNDFDATGAANPDDPLDFTLATSGTITWLKSHRELAIGTNRGEWTGYGSQNNVIAFNDSQFDRQSEYGGTKHVPAWAGTQVAYITNDKKRVRAFYDGGDSINGWASLDISLPADNLMQANVLEVDYAIDPFYRLSCLMGDGSLSISTFYSDYELNAWQTLVTDGEIVSVASVKEETGDSFYLAVNRDQGTFIEYMNPVSNRAVIMDSFVLVNPQGSTTITGLDHLEGRFVAPVANPGSDAGNETVIGIRLVTNGEITIPPDYVNDTIAIGINYVATLITLPRELWSQERITSSTSQGKKRRFARIFARINESGLPLLNGERPQNPDGTMWFPVAPTDFEPVTGDVQVRSDGFDRGVVTMVQDVPLYTEVSAIFGKVSHDAT